MANNETEFNSDNAFRNAIKSYTFINDVSITDNPDFYFEPTNSPRYRENIEVINLAFYALKNPVGHNKRWISILEDNAHNTFLIHLIQQVINGETFKDAAKYLSPLTLRILKMNPQMQNIVFEGNTQMLSNNYDPPFRKYTDYDNDYHLNKYEFGLARLIHKITIKADSFAIRKENDAHEAAVELHKNLLQKYKEYLESNKDNNNQAKYSREQFKEECVTFINNARKILEKHRGWKNFFANLILHIALLCTTAGIGNIIAARYAYRNSNQNHKSLLLSLTETDSAIIINDIENAINKLST